jgi:hypothetical protein
VAVGTGFNGSDKPSKLHSLSRETPLLEPNKPRLEDHANHLKEPSDEPSEVTPAKKPLSNGVSKSRKKQTAMPPDFHFDEGHRLYAKSNGWNRDRAQAEFADFQGYHRAKGSVFMDWNLAWQNWVRRGIRYDQQRAEAEKPPSPII